MKTTKRPPSPAKVAKLASLLKQAQKVQSALMNTVLWSEFEPGSYGTSTLCKAHDNLGAAITQMRTARNRVAVKTKVTKKTTVSWV